jgi:hypothetical protein
MKELVEDCVRASLMSEKAFLLCCKSKESVKKCIRGSGFRYTGKKKIQKNFDKRDDL